MTEKEKTKTNICINVCKSELKKVLSAHKKFALQGKNVEGSELSKVKFKVKDGELEITTTDGFRALQTKMSIEDEFEDASGEFLVSMALAAKLSFVKSEIDLIQIVCKDKEAKFIDEICGTSQRINVCDGKFPAVEDIFPKTNDFSVTLSQKLIKDIASLRTPTGKIDFYFNTKNPAAAILAETTSEQVEQKAILMPMITNKDKEE